MKNSIAWLPNATFYQIYPLGLCGAPAANDFTSQPVNRLERLFDWIPHIKEVGCNAVYLGPVFESDFHGYDTADYLLVDRRLGTNKSLQELVKQMHLNGIKVVLDTVFNHTGRNFFAFQDLKTHKEFSVYKDWFCKVEFGRDNSYCDGLSYEGWYDAFNLVRLSLNNPEVKRYLFYVIDYWIKEFNIDGLRLDVAEIMDKQFLHEMAVYARSLKPDIWLLGEVIMGDYNQWANQDMLDATTNYEAYKALYSSHNDRNYHELAYMLNRQFGETGVYKHLLLYNFADNHDTTRISSILDRPENINPVYTILYTMPGIPSVYYGSEWGLAGVKGEHEDDLLRPEITNIPDVSQSAIYNHIRQLSVIRHKYFALKYGNYRLH